jgi:pyruvate,orthophosphate dikinase
VRRTEVHRQSGGKTIVVKAGEWISIDGTTANVYLGKASTSEPDPNSSYFGKLMHWADDFRGKFGVRANADIPRDAKAARLFGAEGIGLCRTEHMFFAEDRIPVHAGDDSGARREVAHQSAGELLPMQRRILQVSSLPWTDSRW